MGLISKGDFSKQIISKVGFSGVRFPGLLLPGTTGKLKHGGKQNEKRKQRDLAHIQKIVARI